mmetsp:Transcript_6149/g.23252  ORF Transcript_6149/g.23252 Transcript_6149/m.23252 type:complete len:275 (+) Transcript_6149:767-1591(+)
MERAHVKTNGSWKTPMQLPNSLQASHKSLWCILGGPPPPPRPDSRRLSSCSVDSMTLQSLASPGPLHLLHCCPMSSPFGRRRPLNEVHEYLHTGHWKVANTLHMCMPLSWSSSKDRLQTVHSSTSCCQPICPPLSSCIRPPLPPPPPPLPNMPPEARLAHSRSNSESFSQENMPLSGCNVFFHLPFSSSKVSFTILAFSLTSAWNLESSVSTSMRTEQNMTGPPSILTSHWLFEPICFASICHASGKSESKLVRNVCSKLGLEPLGVLYCWSAC